MSSRCLWNRRHEGRRPHITAKEGGYVGHGTNAGCPRPDLKKCTAVQLIRKMPVTSLNHNFHHLL